MPQSVKLPYVIYTLEVDKAYWASITKGDRFFDSTSIGYQQAVDAIASKFPLSSYLEPQNISNYENSLSSGIGSWLSAGSYSRGEKRLYTEPKSSDLKKKRYVLAILKSL